MKEKIKSDAVYLSVCLFLTCYYMQLCNFKMIWMLDASVIFCVIFLIKQKTFRIDIGIWLLAITMYSFYIVQYGARAVITMIPYVPLVMYVMSNYLAADIKKSENWERKFIGILFCLIIGYTIHGLLNSYMYYAGYIKPGTRQWHDIWTRSFMPGTQHSLLYLPVLSVFFPAVIWLREHKITNVLFILAAVFFCYTSLITKSRMSILIFAIVFCGEVLLYAILEGEKVKKIISNKKAWVIAGGLIVTIIILAFLVKDIPVIKAFIDNLSRGGGIFNNVRFQLQYKALHQLFEYPMGGRKMDLIIDYQHMYIHNVWLDMANASGVIPFFAFIAYTIYSIINMIRFLLRKCISSEIKVITAGLYMSFFLFYFVEPALDASIHYITPWIMVNGLIQGILAKDKTR